MNKWQATFLGLRHLPRELSGFEIEAFFTFTATERALIDARRASSLKLGLALQIGFLRMSGRLSDVVRIVPPALWKHLGEQFGEPAPDLASLRAMYRRHRTLFDHQELACQVLEFRPLLEAQRRALVRSLRRELSQTFDRLRLLTYARQWLYERKLLVMREKDLRAILSSASAGRLIVEPGRTIEVACFLRYCLLTNTDRLLPMVRRQQRKPPTRAQLVREHLIEESRAVRSLLSALVVLQPVSSTTGTP